MLLLEVPQPQLAALVGAPGPNRFVCHCHRVVTPGRHPPHSLHCGGREHTGSSMQGQEAL